MSLELFYPYNLNDVALAQIDNPNGGIVIGTLEEASNPNRIFKFNLPEVVVTPKETPYKFTVLDVIEAKKKEKEEFIKLLEARKSDLLKYMEQHPTEARIFNKIGAIPEITVKGEVFWRMPTLEYLDVEVSYKHNNLFLGVDKNIVRDLKLGHPLNANLKSTLRDRLSGSNWYYHLCALAANNINKNLHKPTAGNAWNRYGLYGDSLIFNNSDRTYEFLEDRKLPPSKRRIKSTLDFKDGDFVDIFYDYSPNLKKADTGRGNSHTGTIITDDQMGTPYIVDNVGGRLHMREFKDVFTNNGNAHVLRVYRPGSYVRPYSNTRAEGWKPEHGPVRRGSWAELYLQGYKKGGRLVPKHQYGNPLLWQASMNQYEADNYFTSNLLLLSSNDIDYDLIIRNLWLRENVNHDGYKNGRYYPIETRNGNHDVALGIDIDLNPLFREEAYKGITAKRAEEIARNILEKELPFINLNLAKYASIAHIVTPSQKAGLLDMYWQLKNGLYKYLNLFKGVSRGDLKAIENESKVYYWEKGVPKTEANKKFDAGRHKFRMDTYFKH